MSTKMMDRNVIVKQHYDIIVAGAGVAGIAAALSAKRAGKSVLLVEKGTMAGGLATAGLINFFVAMCNGRGTQIMSGMVDEFVEIALKYSYDDRPDNWKNGRKGEGGNCRYMTHYSPEIYALALMEQLVKEKIDMLFDAQASVPVMNGNHCDGVIVDTCSGSEYYPCGMLIDTTGTAVLLRQAGVPTLSGPNYFSYFARQATLQSCQDAIDKKDIQYLRTCVSGGDASLYGGGQPEGMPPWDGTDSAAVTRYLYENQMVLLNKIKDQNPRERDIVTLPTMLQFRCVCRIQGDYTLLPTDTYRHFDDSISAICDFDRRDYLYEVPYRTLVNSAFDNILTAGRSAAGEGYAWDVLRVIPVAIVTGQAAAHAAAQALDTKTPIAKIDVARLQETLRGYGMDIHFDDALVPPPEKRDSKVENNETY